MQTLVHLRRDRLAELVRWELRLAYGRKLGSRAVGAALFTACLLGVVWFLASQRQEWLVEPHYLSNEIHRFAVLLLVATPFRDPVLRVDEASFGYTALRITIYAVVFSVKLGLPLVASGSIGKDRHSGRLEELRTTVLSRRSVLAAKLIGISLPFLAWGAITMAPYSLSALAEGVAVSDVARLWLEFVGHVVLLASIGLALSALYRSPWSARVVTFLVVWLLLPALWGLILWLLRALDLPVLLQWFGSWRDYWPRNGSETPFATICFAQFALTWAVIAASLAIGTAKLYGDPLLQSIRTGFRPARARSDSTAGPSF